MDGVGGEGISRRSQISHSTYLTLRRQSRLLSISVLPDGLCLLCSSAALVFWFAACAFVCLSVCSVSPCMLPVCSFFPPALSQSPVPLPLAVGWPSGRAERKRDIAARRRRRRTATERRGSRQQQQTTAAAKQAQVCSCRVARQVRKRTTGFSTCIAHCTPIAQSWLAGLEGTVGMDGWH